MPYEYAEQILDATTRLKAAKTAEDALAQLARLQALADDHDALRMLASSFLLVAGVWLDEQQERNELPAAPQIGASRRNPPTEGQ